MLLRETIYKLLYDRDAINTDIQATINENVKPWGIHVTSLEIKDVNIPIELRSTVTKLVQAEKQKM